MADNKHRLPAIQQMRRSEFSAPPLWIIRNVIGEPRFSFPCKDPFWLPLSKFPSRERAWIYPKRSRERLLRQASGFPATHQPLRKSLTFRKRIESKKFDDFGEVIDPRRGVPALPIYDRHRIAAYDSRHVALPQSEIKPALADGFTHRFRIGRIPLALDEMWPVGATHPSYGQVAKRQ